MKFFFMKFCLSEFLQHSFLINLPAFGRNYDFVNI